MEFIQDKTNVQESANETVNLSLFSVGAILNITCKVLLKNPIVFFGLTLLSGALEEVAEYSLRLMIPGVGERTFKLLQFFVGTLFRQWVGGAIAYGVYQSLKGNGASLGASLFCGMRRLVPLVCVSFLYSVGVFLGSILLVVPGLILICIWDVAIPACVVERLGPVDSLFRSEALTKGCRMKIFGLILILMIILQVVIRTAPLLIHDVRPRMYYILLELFDSIPTALINIMPAVIYFELRRVKEGVAVQNLANVFD